MRMSGVLLFQEQNLGLPKQAHFCYLQMRPLSQLSSEGNPIARLLVDTRSFKMIIVACFFDLSLRYRNTGHSRTSAWA